MNHVIVQRSRELMRRPNTPDKARDMFHGKNNVISMLFIGAASVLSFLLVEEVGRLVYMTFYTPTSGGRELYYAIWLFSMYLAPIGIMLSCILKLKLKWNALFLACFSFSVFYVFRDSPLWATLLLVSYLAALFVAFILNVAISKISIFNSRRC